MAFLAYRMKTVRQTALWYLMGAAAVLLCFPSPCSAQYAVQVGAFTNENYFRQASAILNGAGFLTINSEATAESAPALSLLLVGPYSTRNEAEAAREALAKLGFNGFTRRLPRDLNPMRQRRNQIGEQEFTAEAPRAQRKSQIRFLQKMLRTPRPPCLGGESLIPSQLVNNFDYCSAKIFNDSITVDPAEQQVEPVSFISTASIDQPSYRPLSAGVHLTDSPLVRANYLAAEDPFSTAAEPQPAAKPALPFSINGYVQNEVAYTVASPDHWSKFKNLAELALKKDFTPDISFKVSGRFWYDGVYDFTTFFPDRVRRDQRFEAMFRETYLDVGTGDWSFQVGRQQIVWGEVVGLFFADVVSARDLREFIIPDLDYIRTPQWAARAEYFRGDFKAEAMWIPYMTYDQIGKPGADFFPSPLPPPPGFGEVIRNERQPHQLDNSGVGVRASYLISGWDLAAFYYGSTDVSPTFFRQISLSPTPTFIYTPNHDRINQIGGTVSKDFDSFVLRGEGVYTFDKWFNVTRLNDANGVVRQGFLDYILGLDFPLPWESRLNVQFFQRWFPHHDPDMIPRRVESGATLLVSTKLFDDKVEPELLYIESLNRLDYFTRFRISWRFADNWRAMLGTAFLGGKKTGLFGQYDNKDRVFTELRYAF